MRIPVLDHGYIELVSVEGSDQLIAETARTSTSSSGDPDKDAKLVTRLIRDQHTSPVEFAGLIVDVHMPIFVRRQCMRSKVGT